MLELVTFIDDMRMLQSVKARAVGVRHGFTTRGRNATPAGRFEFDFTPPPAQSELAYEGQLGRLAAAVGVSDASMTTIRQVHGCTVVRVDRPGLSAADADACMTNQPGVSLLIRVADCVPVLLWSRDGRVVAAVHAGWRGVAADIAGKTVQSIADTYGVSPTELAAAVGPCIRAAHFEVGDEVVAAMHDASLTQHVLPPDASRAKSHVDLAGAVVTQLERAGLSPASIEDGGLCTFADPALFFSHRRDAGDTGRLAAIIAPRP